MPAPDAWHQPPGNPELYLDMSVKTYITWDIPAKSGICRDILTKPGISQFWWLIPTYPWISQNYTKTDGISLDNSKSNKNRWDIQGWLDMWLIQGYPKTSTVIQTYSSLSLFSVGKATGWYKSGSVRLTLCILFTQNIRGIYLDRSHVWLSRDIFNRMGICRDIPV